MSNLRRLRIDQVADKVAIPDFIDAEMLGQRLTTTAISKLFSVGGMAASSYINKLEREERPLSFIKESCSSVHGFRKLFLVSDVLDAAIKDGMPINTPKKKAEKEKTENLTLTQKRLKSEISELRQIKLGLQKELRLMTGNLSDIAPVLGQTRFSLVPQADLIKKSLSYGDACGVYFLIKDSEIVYIGQSINIASRITQHRDKEFDSVSYVACHRSELDILESLYILAYQPELNGSNGNGPTGGTRPATPITLSKIVQMFHRGELSK